MYTKLVGTYGQGHALTDRPIHMLTFIQDLLLQLSRAA